MPRYVSPRSRRKIQPFSLDPKKRPKVAIIIPAYNEADRIGSVVRASLDSEFGDEVIVVCDGCRDNTAKNAAKFPGVRVLDLPVNVGKAGAMAAGVKSTDAEVFMFIDGDLIGLTSDHIDTIIKPVLTNQCEMCIGIFRGGKFWSDAAQIITPYYSGQRAMRRNIFTAIPNIQEARMGVEVALNEHAKRVRARVLRVVLYGVSNCHKEQKMGLAKGIQARKQMFQEMLDATKRAHRRTRVERRNKRKSKRKDKDNWPF
jgi:glycosyltransferase involved in cell wall biosynthesis